MSRVAAIERDCRFAANDLVTAASNKGGGIMLYPARTLIVAAVIAAALPLAAMAAPEPPTPQELAAAIQHSLHPFGTSVRDIEVQVRGGGGDVDVWHGRQFRKSDSAGRRVVTLLTDPPSVSGFAVLVTGESMAQDTYWIYVPPVRRVRRLIHEGRYENFLGTELSAADFGFFRIDPAAARVTGRATMDAKETWKIEETMPTGSGYSRAVVWIADSGLPLRRELYDTSGKLWKTETREQVEQVAGAPIPLVLRVQDVQMHGETVLKYSDVKTGVGLDDSLFAPEALPALGERTAAIR